MSQEDKNKNIILVGMMATGKSTVGAILAEELGYELVDLDHVIIETEGRSIAEIFAEDGEEYFRSVETAVLKQMLESENKLISTGGGAVLAPGNTALMLSKGHVVALTATEEEIIARVSGDENRPLLAGNAEERVRRIMEDRQDAYLFAHYTVDTTGLTAVEVSQHILMHYRG
ncbi:shikimate kinase [Paenibacillus odorifer]|uniref:Shikimate kinase n=2 Tax=Paenibacillus TaxID=44249 RepID=A0A1R0X6D5_9BACL|nr:shikimate kinase [Paenibacillus odorifer]